MVAGAPVVGWVSQTYGPARGLQLLAGAALFVALVSVVRSRTQRRPSEMVTG